MGFLTYVILAVLVVLAYRKGMVWGIGVTVAAAAYAIYTLLPRWYAVMCRRAFDEKDYKKAEKYGEKGFARMNFNQKVSYAYMLVRMGKSERAIDILDSFIQLRGLDSKNKNTAKRQRCLAYYKEGRYEEALRDANEVIEDGFATKTLYGLKGMLMLVLGRDLDETTKFCEEAYEYDEDDRDIQDNMSICYYLQNDLEMAEEINGYVREENPEFIEGYYHGAQIYIKKKDYKKAQELVSKISSCSRTDMTTVSEEAVAVLKREIDGLITGEITEPEELPLFTLKDAVAPPADFNKTDTDEDESGSIYDEYNMLEDEEENEGSIYDEINELEKGNR